MAATQDRHSIREVFAKMSTRTKRIAAGVAGATAVTAALVIATASAASTVGVKVVDPSYPDGTIAIADKATESNYDIYPTGSAATSYDTTEFAGRLWADKSVYAPNDGNDNLGEVTTINLADPNRDLDGDPAEQSYTKAGEFNVQKSASGTFLTSISLLSSSLTTELYEPVPLDIVLVLDKSGSMKVYNGYSDPVQTEPTSLKDSDPSDVDQDKRYFILEYENLEAEALDEADPGSQTKVYKQIRNTATDSTGRYFTNVDNGNYQRYYFTTDVSLNGKKYTGNDNTNENYRWATLYRRDQEPSRMTNLNTATKDFLETIAANNTELAEMGYTKESMSRVSMIAFSGSYYSQNAGTYVSDSYQLKNSDKTAYGYSVDSKTNIVTLFTTYTNDGSTEGTASVSHATDIIDGNNGNPGFKANGSTAADYGLTLAESVFEGDVYQANDYGNANRAGTTAGAEKNGARANAKKVIVFFTDGNPKHAKGNAPTDFSGMVAEKTIKIAEQLKDQDILIYTVAVMNQAEAGDMTLNANIYLNGVSSNYSGANPTNGQDNPVSGFVPPASNTWTPNQTTWYGSNQGYFLVAREGERSISDAFKEIAVAISSGGGEDSTTTGRDGNTAVTVTDYMEFKGLDGMLYGTSAETTQFYAPGTQEQYAKRATVQRDDRSATESVYTMSYQVDSALLSPPEGQEQVNLNIITVQVTRSTDPKVGDTVTIKVPPELIPSIRYNVKEQREDGGVITTTTTRTNVDPLRIFYSVGPKATTLSNVISQLEDQALRDPDALNESDKQTSAYRSFVADAAAYGSGNAYSLYNNLKPSDGATKGTTTVTMTLSKTNPYYFYTENEPLYVKLGEGDNAEYKPATSSNYTSGDKLYVRHKVWTVGTGGAEDTYYEWTGTRQLNSDTGAYYIPAETIKTEDQDYTSAHFAKDSADGTVIGNHTETATDYLNTVFDGTIRDTAGNYSAIIYLGNNGRLDIPVYGTLSVSKEFSADTGFDLPANATASFTLKLYGDGGTALSGNYPAIIRDSEGHPVDHETHAKLNTTEAALFEVNNNYSFTLRDGETLRVTGLPDGATYEVVETGQTGYKATVTNNDGTVNDTFARNDSSHTAPATPASTPDQGGGGE